MSRDVLLDARRREYGLPPIFVNTPRPLTQAERKGRKDRIIRDESGRVSRHLVPMVKDGWIVYVDVMV